jgi:hypothetical protein
MTFRETSVTRPGRATAFRIENGDAKPVLQRCL